MNNLAYVQYSQEEANPKIWHYLMGKDELLKRKAFYWHIYGFR